MNNELSVDLLIDQAKNSTGLNDFAGNSFKEGLGVLIESVNNVPGNGEGFRTYFQHIILGLLSGRLQLVEYLKKNPEIEKEEIEKPIIIVGLPRSGTTFLHTLLSLDPLSRYIRNYESFPPFCPPPELMPHSVDPRLQGCHENLEGMFSSAPHLRGINGINFMAQGTAECQNFTAAEFVHMGWSVGSSLFDYGSWVAECDMQTAYGWHKKLLQLLQWKLPNERWVLKAPMHLFGLSRLLEEYPDAKVIFTHRDPVQAMISGVSMTCQWTEFTTGQADVDRIKKWYMSVWEKGLQRAMEVKERMEDHQCIDVSHQALLEDPLPTVEKVYTHLDIPYTAIAKKRMHIWLQDNPRSRFGTHACSSQKHGVEASEVKKQFEFYLKRYDFK